MKNNPEKNLFSKEICWRFFKDSKEPQVLLEGEKVLLVNEAFRDLWGEVRGRKLEDFFQPLFGNLADRVFPLNGIMPGLLKLKEEIVIELSFTIVEDGRLSWGIIRKSVPDRVGMAELAENRFLQIFENSAHGIALADLNGCYLQVNQAFCKILGYSSDELLMMSFKEVTHPWDRMKDSILLGKLRRGEIDHFQIEKRYIHKNGKTVWVNQSASVVRNRKGHPIHLISQILDISEQKANREELALFFNVTLDMLCIAGFDGYFKRLSPSWAEKLGWSLEELSSKPFLDFVHPDDRKMTISRSSALEKGEAVINFENRYRRKDGTYCWISWNSFAIIDRGIIIAAARDITRIKEQMERIQSYSDRLALALKAGQIGIWDWNVNNNTITWDSRMYDLYGLQKKEEADVFAVWSNALHPEDRDKALKAVSWALENNAEFNMEFRIIRTDGTVRYLKAFALVKGDEEQHMIGVNYDVTDRKKKEDELNESKKRADEANKAKSEFLANMSHEIRTPLNAVIGFSELLDNLIEDSRQRGYLNSIKTAGRGLLKLINDILDLSKIEAGKMDIMNKPLIMENLLDEIKDLFSGKAEQGKISLIIECPDDFPGVIFMDEVRLRQVFVNLVGNGIKFTEHGYVKLKVNLDKQNEKTGTCDFSCTVEDSGIGISPEEQAVVFEAFRQQAGQSNRKYGGTGLGLTISRKLVEMMKGELAFTSTPGKGSCFTIHFREVKFSRSFSFQLPAEEARFSSIRFRGQKILVADDQESNRSLIRESLQHIGLLVTEAKNGEECVFFARELNPALILLDLRMPVMDGFEAGKILKNDPRTKHIPVIILTASTAISPEKKEALKESFEGFMSKPLILRKLVEIIAKHVPQEKVEEQDGKDNGDLRELFITLTKQPLFRNTMKNTLLPALKELSHGYMMSDVQRVGDILINMASTFNSPLFAGLGKQLQAYSGQFDVLGINTITARLLELSGQYNEKEE